MLCWLLVLQWYWRYISNCIVTHHIKLILDCTWNFNSRFLIAGRVVAHNFSFPSNISESTISKCVRTAHTRALFFVFVWFLFQTKKISSENGFDLIIRKLLFSSISQLTIDWSKPKLCAKCLYMMMECRRFDHKRRKVFLSLQIILIV